MHRYFALGAPEYVLERRQWLPRRREEVFNFFCDPRNLPEITPAWLGFIITRVEPPVIAAGTLLDYRLYWMGVPYRWRTRIEEWSPGARFTDTQLRGPYILWHHTHTFEASGGGTLMTDRVRYRLPFGPFGMLMHAAIVRRQLAQIFDYRAQRIAAIYSDGIVQQSPPGA